MYHQELPLSKFGTSGTSFTVYADNFAYGDKGHFTPTASEMLPISNTANLFVRKCVVYISNNGFVSYGGVFSAYSKDIIIIKSFNSDGTYVYRFVNQGGSDAEVNFNVCQSLSYGNVSAIPVISGVKIHYQGLSSALCLKITIDKDLTNVDTSKFVVGLIIL